MRKKEIDRQREADRESEGSGPAETAVRLKARGKVLGNTQEIAVVCAPLLYILNYEGSVEIH